MCGFCWQGGCLLVCLLAVHLACSGHGDGDGCGGG